MRAMEGLVSSTSSTCCTACASPSACRASLRAGLTHTQRACTHAAAGEKRAA